MHPTGRRPPTSHTLGTFGSGLVARFFGSRWVRPIPGWLAVVGIVVIYLLVGLISDVEPLFGAARFSAKRFAVVGLVPLDQRRLNDAARPQPVDADDVDFDRVDDHRCLQGQ